MAIQSLVAPGPPGGSKPSDKLAPFTCATSLFSPTTRPTHEHSTGNPYDSFLVNRDFLAEGDTASVYRSSTVHLKTGEFSDHDFVQMSIRFLHKRE